MSTASCDYDERLIGKVNQSCGLLHRHRPRAELVDKAFDIAGGCAPGAPGRETVAAERRRRTGTALVAGAAGTTVFGLLGLVAAIPLLLRLKRRFGSWWAPVIGFAVFVAMFLLSAFVIGPTISDRDGAPADPPAPSSSSQSEHHP
jgi:hypothetical protein